MSTPDPNEERFKRIERKLSLLVILSGVQLLMLTLIGIGFLMNEFLPSTLTLVLLTIIVVGGLFLFRKQIPSWFGSFSRYVFARMLSAQKPGTTKDESIL